MDRKLANNLLAGTMWSMYDTGESTVQFCLQKPNVHNRTLSKNTYKVFVDLSVYGIYLVYDTYPRTPVYCKSELYSLTYTLYL